MAAPDPESASTQNSTNVLAQARLFATDRQGERSRMAEPRQTLQFELDADAIRLLYRSVRFHLDKWPGGPDPREQEDLHRLQTLLYAALLECSFDQEGER